MLFRGAWVRILEWIAIPSSRGSSQPGDQTQVSRIAGRFSTGWATREAPLRELEEGKILLSPVLALFVLEYYNIRNVVKQTSQQNCRLLLWTSQSEARAVCPHFWLDVHHCEVIKPSSTESHWGIQLDQRCLQPTRESRRSMKVRSRVKRDQDFLFC